MATDALAAEVERVRRAADRLEGVLLLTTARPADGSERTNRRDAADGARSQARCEGTTGGKSRRLRGDSGHGKRSAGDTHHVV